MAISWEAFLAASWAPQKYARAARAVHTSPRLPAVESDFPDVGGAWVFGGDGLGRGWTGIDSAAFLLQMSSG